MNDKFSGQHMPSEENAGHTPRPYHGIHPAPAEFSAAEIETDPILHFFHYAHLPPTLAATSSIFFSLASVIVRTLPRNAERSVALRKLLEAKDAAVRANVQSVKAQRSTGPELGEPVELGGHSEDRDGPLKFDG